MAWSKLKNIVIVILLLLNLFLLLLIVGQQFRTRRYEVDTLKQTVEALSLNGINVEEDALPEKSNLSVFSATLDSSLQATAAGVFLKDETPIVSNNGTHMVYSALSGNLSFRSNGEFFVSLSLPCPPDLTPVQHAVTLFQSLGLTTDEPTVSDQTVTALPMVSGAPVFNAPLTLVYKDQLLLSASGYLPGKLTADTQQSLLALPDALISILEYVLDRGIICRSIIAVTPGYTATPLTDSLRLTPCWLVETDIENYYVDALTGAVSPATE